MNIDTLKAECERLGTSDDLTRIKSGLYGICSELGSVSRLEVLMARQGKQRQALCFLRMGCAEQEMQVMQVMRSLGFSRCADELVLVVDLPGEVPETGVAVNPALAVSA